MNKFFNKINYQLYYFAQRHYWLSPVVDRIRWSLEKMFPYE